jgi:CDP-4-dehydro-6-deoxyglucose reductase, E1
MDYFTRLSASNEEIDTVLSQITPAIRNFYENINEKSHKVRLHESTLGYEELIAFCGAFLSGNITMSKVNHDYEQKAAELFNSKFCLSCNSGSSANLIAIAALVESGHIKRGDKVIVPALSWSTTIFPLAQYGLIPIFIDQSPIDFNMSIDQMTLCLKEHSDIRGLMLIHTYGIPADMDKIRELIDKYNLILVEDTCEAMGALWCGRSVGSFGSLGTFSTYYSHHITTFEGGLVLSQDEELVSIAKSIRSHGWLRHLDKDSSFFKKYPEHDPGFLFAHTGYNLRLSDPQAAIGLVQLNKLNSYIKARNNNAKLYEELITNSVLSPHIVFPTVSPNAKPSWFGFPILFPGLSNSDIYSLRHSLMKKGIESRPFLCGDFTQQPVMKKTPHEIFGDLAFSRLLHKSSIALPCHQSLSSHDISYVVEVLLDSYQALQL